jgi:hypothetical protein
MDDDQHVRYQYTASGKTDVVYAFYKDASEFGGL